LKALSFERAFSLTEVENVVVFETGCIGAMEKNIVVARGEVADT
jgi:hypothetical protein